MNVCTKCGKENQDHYKFCLGCGAELKPTSMGVVAPPPGREPSAQRQAAEPARPSRPPAAAMVGAAAESATDTAETSAPTPLAASRPLTGRASQPATAASSAAAQPPETAAAPSDAAESFGLSKTPAAHQIALASPPNVEDLPPTEPPESADEPAAGTCLDCNTVNPPSFIFCGNCGARLAQPAGTQTHDRAEESSPAKRAHLAHKGSLALIRPDGSEGGIYYLEQGQVAIGRSSGAIFEHDSYLSPSHAQLTFQEDGVLLEDLGSLNGLFLKINAPEVLASGDIFRIGQELLRFDEILDPAPLEDGTEIMGSPNPGYWGRLSVIMGPGEDGSAFPLLGEEMVLGRERGDILFSDDGYVSGTHAKIGVSESGYQLTDLGSSNGTFLRLTEPRIVTAGSFLLMGQQLFRLDF